VADHIKHDAKSTKDSNNSEVTALPPVPEPSREPSPGVSAGSQESLDEEDLYRDQLHLMQEMLFTDKKRNIEVLRWSKGDVSVAIDIIIQQDLAKTA
jgi:hypothetical protein